MLAGGLEAAAAPVDLEVAWGMLDVKRVASLTLRGPTLDAMAPCCGRVDGKGDGVVGGHGHEIFRED